MKYDYIIYTDGSYRASKKQGGYAIAIYNGEGELIEYKFKAVKYTTNNRMELMAFISALKSVPEGSKIKVVSDSEYVINPITKGWLTTWVKINFKEKKNDDLWREVAEILPKYILELEWTKGHEDDELNNFVDMLAQHASTIILD